ncbi:MAG TPA: DegT/DnrJ/EryC1/StrS family aminotransferase, partial [Nitrospira sp.]|nr:DegT/DnrJ/EryC1/StrS family aminotransferase [Nitrospira sp.]HNK16624.1 DegT/DnrJ/EryC1/StrS family aminotransferase [Nitrospira sp.]HNO35678.1 DegT/DnrJ/EryC1/StrS family aminotransferase [Nitrospira sp.]
MAAYLPFHVPEIDDEDIEAVVNVMRSGWLTTGAKARQFEQEFAAKVGARYAVALNSCTAALH